MRSTLIGVFDDRRAAEHARNELLRAGFADDEVDLRTGTDDRAWRQSDDRPLASERHAYDDETESSIGETVSGWFRSLFGFDDTQDIGIYTEAVRRGDSVVTVDAADSDRLDRATDILEDCGSVDIDSMANDWQSQGWARPSGASDTRSAVSSRDAGEEPHAGEVPHAGETRKAPAVDESLRVGKRVVGRRRLRVYTRMVEPSARKPDDGGADAATPGTRRDI